MPAKSVYGASSLCYQVFSVIDRQANVSSWPVQAGCRQVWFPQGSAGHRQSVDGVRLAIRACTVAGVRHHLWRHSHDLLPCPKQVSFQAPGQVAAVLDCPGAFDSELLGPPEQLQMVSAGRTGRSFTELATHVSDWQPLG